MESKGQAGRTAEEGSKGRCSIGRIHPVLLCFARFSLEEIFPWR